MFHVRVFMFQDKKCKGFDLCQSENLKLDIYIM